MPIRFPCPHCRVLLRIPETLAGKKKPCPKCGRELEIPAASIPAAAVPPPVDVMPLAARACPKCNRSLAAADVICIDCGFDLRTGKKLERPTTCPECGSKDLKLYFGDSDIESSWFGLVGHLFSSASKVTYVCLSCRHELYDDELPASLKAKLWGIRLGAIGAATGILFLIVVFVKDDWSGKAKRGTTGRSTKTSAYAPGSGSGGKIDAASAQPPGGLGGRHLYIDNDQAKGVAIRVGGTTHELKPYEILKVDLDDGDHEISGKAGDGTAYEQKGFKIVRGARFVVIYNPGRRGVYRVHQVTYVVGGTGGVAPTIVETVENRLISSPRADYGLDRRRPSTMLLPGGRIQYRYDAFKVAGVLTSSDHACAMLTAKGAYFDRAIREKAFGYLRARGDSRALEASFMVLERGSSGRSGALALKTIEEKWRTQFGPRLVALAGARRAGYGNAPAIARILVARAGLAGTVELLHAAPVPALRNLMMGISARSFTGRRRSSPEQVARAAIVLLQVGLASGDDRARQSACRGLVAHAEHLDAGGLARLKAAIGTIDGTERPALVAQLHRVEGRLLGALAAVEDTPASLERLLKAVLDGPIELARSAVGGLGKFSRTDVTGGLVMAVGSGTDERACLILSFLSHHHALRRKEGVQRLLLASIAARAPERQRLAMAALLADPGAWLPGTEEAIEKAIAASPRLAGYRRSLRDAAARGRRARRARTVSRMAAGDLDEVLRGIDSLGSHDLYLVGAALRRRRLSAGQASRIARRFAEVGEAGKRNLCSLFLRSHHPALQPLAVWGYTNGQRDAAWWFSARINAGDHDLAFKLVDLARRSTPPEHRGGRAYTDRFRIALLEVIRKGTTRRALEATRLVLQESEPLPRRDRFGLVRSANAASSYNRAARRECRNLVARWARKYVRDPDALVRWEAFFLLCWICGDLRDRTLHGELKAMAAGESDDRLRRRMESHLARRLSRYFGR